MKKLIFLDMDGVICDWMRGCLAAHKRYDLIQKYDRGEYPNDWLLEGELGSEDEIWIPVDEMEEVFWDELEPYAWAPEIVEMIHNTGIPWYICTHSRETPFSYSGKMKWIQRYFGKDFKNIVMIKKKSLLAGPNRLLIDDSEPNCKAFRKRGGMVQLFAQPWNYYRDRMHCRLEDLKVTLEMLEGAEEIDAVAS